MIQRLLFLGFLTLFFAGFFSLKAQDFLEGHISDQRGIPVEGASVFFNHSKKGTVSAENGSFKLAFPEGAEDSLLMVRHVEFRPFEISLNEILQLKEGLRIILSDRVDVLQQVQISGQRDRLGPDSDASVQRISPIRPQAFPTPFGEFTKILTSLPGVSANSELTAAYRVRGGNFDENLIYVEDMPVYRPFLISAGEQEGLSFVNPELVNEIYFSAGGWQAKYGDKLSSNLNVYYKRPDSLSGAISLGLLGGTAHLETASKNGRSHLITGFRHKDGRYLLRTLDVDGQYFPTFTDWQFFLTHDLNASKPGKTELAILGNVARNRYDVIPESRETRFGTFQQSFNLNVAFQGREVLNYNTYQTGAKLTHKFSDRWESKFILSGVYTEELENLDIESGYRICDIDRDPNSPTFNQCVTIRGIGTDYNFARNRLNAFLINAENRHLIKINRRHRLETGVGMQQDLIRDRLVQSSFVDSANFVRFGENINTQQELTGQTLFSYLQHEYRPDSVHRLSLGLRWSWNRFTDEHLWSPRLQYSILPRWNRNWSFRLASGLYQQHPFFREYRDFEGNLNPDLKAQKSVHLVGGADYLFQMWGRPFQFTSEAYYKYLWDVVPYDIDNVRIRYYAQNSAQAYAAGADFRVNGEFIPGIESWFSLGLMQTRERVEGDARGLIRRPSDQWLTMAIFFQDHLPNNPSVRAHVNLMYGSGLPFGPPNNPDFRNSFPGPAYQRLDLGLTKIFYFQSWAKGPEALWLSLEILNALGVTNPISFSWVQDFNGIQYGVPNSLTARFFNLKMTSRF